MNEKSRLGQRGARAFDPDWTIHPGATLQDWMDEKGINARLLAVLMWPIKRDGYRADRKEAVERLLVGKEKITKDIAARLDSATGIPASFWRNYEARFRADLKAGRKWTP